MRRRLRTALFVVPFLAMAAADAAGAPTRGIDTPSGVVLVRVYVHVDDARDGDERAALDASAKDLKAALAGKKKDLVIVDTEDDADVIITVVDRATTIPRIVFGPSTMSGPPSGGMGPSDMGAMRPQRAVHLRVTLTLSVKSDPITLTNKTSPPESSGGWRSAADDVAKQIDKWIVDHRATILDGAARR